MKRIFISLGFIAITCVTVKASQDSLNQYVAKYKFPEGSPLPEINIALDNGSLQISSQMGTSTMEKINDDQFSITAYNGTATFGRNTVKKITTVKIEALGIIMEGIREDGNGTSSGKIILPMKFPIPMMPTDL
jgi:hypothetical protein